MIRRKSVRLVAVFLVGLGVVLGLTLSPSAAEKFKFSPGNMVVADNETVTIHVFNPTGNDISVDIEIKDSSGYSSDGPSPQEIPAGEANSLSFICTNGPCGGAPMVTSPTAKVAPTVVFQEDGAVGVFTHAFAGDWKRIN